MTSYFSKLYKIFNSPRRGFTLIELLVVIAIIGVLATIAIIGLNSARRSSRDSKRVADIKQLQTALQLYYNAHNKFPATPTDDDCISRADTTKGLGNTNCAVLSDAGFTSAASSSGVIYMANIPKNPQPNGNIGGYHYVRQSPESSTTTNAYEIEFELEGKVEKFAAGDYIAYQDGIRSGTTSVTAAGTWQSSGEDTLYGPNANSTGFVGIGFASGEVPAAKLHVKGGTGSDSLVILNATSGTGKLLRVNNATTEVMTVLNGGNLGIGDTTPASALTVGSGDLFQVDSTGNIVKIRNITYSWPSAQGAASTVLTNDGAGVLSWAAGGGGGGGGWTDNGATITLATPGDNVGIGGSTSLTSVKLVVEKADGASSIIQMWTNTGGSNNEYLGLYNFADDFLLVSGANGTGASKKLHFGVGDSGSISGSDMTIDSAGNVGIGTTTPGGHLQIDNRGGSNDATLLLSNTASSYNVIRFQHPAGTSVGDIHSFGSTWTTSGAWTPDTIVMNGINASLYATGNNTGIIRFWTQTGGASVERVRISNAGYVGIGATGGPNTVLDIAGAFSVRGMAAPAVSPAGQGRIYFDSTANVFKVSENGGAYVNLVGGGGGGSGDVTDVGSCTTGACLPLDGSTHNIGLGTQIIFEGATNDAFETTISVTDPTADQTITIPNLSGTAALVTATVTGASQTPVETSMGTNYPSFGGGGDYTTVHKFTANASGQITALGCVATNVISGTVRLFDFNAGTLLASTPCTTGASSWTYVNIAAVPITAGTVYQVTYATSNGLYTYYSAGAYPVTVGDITLNTGGYTSGLVTTVIASPSGQTDRRTNPGFRFNASTSQTPTNSGDFKLSGDIQATTADKGIVVKSPDGLICRRITINNAGSVVANSVTCP